MLTFLLFYVLVIPIIVLMHEIGHGIGVVCISKSHVHVYLGSRNEGNKENLKLGRLHLHIYWSYVGYAVWDGNLDKRQKAIALAGGPFMSLLLGILFGIMVIVVPPGDLHSFLWGITIFNISQFVLTTIPITYPRWMVDISRQGHIMKQCFNKGVV
ncbi:hypothetical protein [Peribacillus simplex]|uniref:hypothetical protein n=1 Tax=Peribacillus simplex TaxID=1478 RepID=UPI00366A6348